jgi:hypothetical protein
MFEWFFGIFANTPNNRSSSMSEVIEDDVIEDEEEEEEEEQQQEEEQEKEQPKRVPPKKSGLTKAKKERKPRVPKAEYKGQTIQLSSDLPVPINHQEKGSKRIARTKTATFDIADKNTLVVTVKKGRGTRVYEYPYVSREKLADAIKAAMEEAKVNTLDEVRLAIHFPGLYWNAAYAFERRAHEIAEMLRAAGIPNGQRRQRRAQQ